MPSILVRYLAQLPTKYTNSCWHYSLQLKLSWVRKFDQWGLQVPGYEPPVWVRVDTDTLKRKKETICFTCRSPQAPARKDSSLTLKAATILWTFGYRKPSCLSPLWPVLLPSVAAKEYNIRGLKHSLSLHKCLHKKITVIQEKNTKSLSLKSTECF